MTLRPLSRHNASRTAATSKIYRSAALPHFEVTDDSGRRRHVFFHAAKWSSDDLAAYLGLLAVIIEQEYGGDSRSLWVMDLRAGEDVKWRASSRMRRRNSATLSPEDLSSRNISSLRH